MSDAKSKFDVSKRHNRISRRSKTAQGTHDGSPAGVSAKLCAHLAKTTVDEERSPQNARESRLREEQAFGVTEKSKDRLKRLPRPAQTADLIKNSPEKPNY